MSRRKINKDDLVEIYKISYATKQNAHYFAVHMKHSPRQTTLWIIKHTLINIKELELFKVHSLNIKKIK